MRMILLQIGIQNWIVHIFIGVAAALVVPILIQEISVRIKFPYLFEWKRSRPAAPGPVLAGGELPKTESK
jgi:hypothetical protein